MKIIAVILFLMALTDIAGTINTLIKSYVKFEYMIKYKEFYTMCIQVAGDLLLIIFLIIWWRG